MARTSRASIFFMSAINCAGGATMFMTLLAAFQTLLHRYSGQHDIVVGSAVAGLTDAQLDTPYRPGGWTVRQVVHHLADSHIHSYIRFKLALTEDEPTVDLAMPADDPITQVSLVVEADQKFFHGALDAAPRGHHNHRQRAVELLNARKQIQTLLDDAAWIFATPSVSMRGAMSTSTRAVASTWSSPTATRLVPPPIDAPTM